MDLDHYHRRAQHYRLDFLITAWARHALSIIFCCVCLASSSVNASRIISLSPNLTEILWDIGAGSQLVARDRNSCYPYSVQSLPVVADYHHMNIEAILKLRPDIVVVESSPFLKCEITKLRQFKIKVYVNHANSLSDLISTIHELGRLSGQEKLAQQKALVFTKAISQPLKTHRPRVFYELWSHPLLSVNERNTIGDIITRCGGDNIMAQAFAATPRVSVEMVVRANPDIIISSVPGFEQAWQRWPHINAVRQHAFIFVPADMIERTGPRLVGGINRICQGISNWSPNRGLGSTISQR